MGCNFWISGNLFKNLWKKVGNFGNKLELFGNKLEISGNGLEFSDFWKIC